MPLYYYERPYGNGSFEADNDEEAIKSMPRDTLILYKESDTKDGMPFIIVYEDSK